MIRRSFYRAAVALNGTSINPNVKEAKVSVYVSTREEKDRHGHASTRGPTRGAQGMRFPCRGDLLPTCL